MKFIIDEDLSPRVARYLCQEFCFDAIAVRDRGLLGATDPEVLAIKRRLRQRLTDNWRLKPQLYKQSPPTRTDIMLQMAEL